MISKFCSIIFVGVCLFSNISHTFRICITRKELDQNLENEKVSINKKEDNETSLTRTCSEAVGMEKLIPSLRQRQQIGNPINIHHAKNYKIY